MYKILSVFAILALLTGCPRQAKETTQKIKDAGKSPMVELQVADFDELVGWKKDNFAEAIPAFIENCKKISLNKNQAIDRSKIVISTKDYHKICQRFSSAHIKSSEQFRRFIEQNFIPYLVLDNGNADGKFTSYYEAEIRASKSKHDQYQYPVYGKPESLIEVNLQEFDATLPNRRLVGRVEKQKFIPYYTRAEIENADFAAPVLMWGNDPIDIYIMQIQGSAIASLDDGTKLRIGYADNNGYPFKGIGSILLSKKLLEPGKGNMMNIKEWLRDNPDLAKPNMQENKRFVFHRTIEGDGPIGALGVPLKAGRSMAVDRSVVPLGSLLWLDTTTPDKQPLQRLVAAQDIGGAIKGAVRGDYFWGSGGDEILAKAGSMNSSGQYYILIPREQ